MYWGTGCVDELDYRILETLQNDFPLSERPYEVISDELKIPCEQLLDRLQLLMADGMVRRFGVSFDSRKFGRRSILAAISIKSGIIE